MGQGHWGLQCDGRWRRHRGREKSNALAREGYESSVRWKTFYTASTLSLIQAFPEQELSGNARNCSLFLSALMWYRSKPPLVEQLFPGPGPSPRLPAGRVREVWPAGCICWGGTTGAACGCPGQQDHAQLAVPRGWAELQASGECCWWECRFLGKAGFFFLDFSSLCIGVLCTYVASRCLYLGIPHTVKMGNCMSVSKPSIKLPTSRCG